jgi:Glycosyl transferases group 1
MVKVTFPVRRFVRTPLNLLRQHGVLFLASYSLKWLRWQYLTVQVRRLYFAGQRKHRARTVTAEETSFATDIVAAGSKRVAEVTRKYVNVYVGREDLRVLINTPEDGAPYFYFLDLGQCLRHTGVPARIHLASAGNLEEDLADFRPSVYLTCDGPLPHGQASRESAAVRVYKKRYGLARLHIPHYLAPLRRRRESSRDIARMALHRQGELADAFFGYFETVFWDVFCWAYKTTGFSYYPLPFAANPLRHYPVMAAKDLDWAMATANGDYGERASLTRRYMGRIMREYRGLIAGSGWGAGIVPIAPDRVAEFFCRARVAPNLAAASNVRYPLDCGAKVHELSAMGVFQLASETDALRKYYTPNEVVGIRSPAECEERFAYFVTRPGVRQTYIMNSMARTFAENTYFQRIEKLIALLDQHKEWF